MKKLTLGSVCSGIEAASVAVKDMGWDVSWLAEIEPFPSAVLKHHYPHIPNLGDMTLLPEKIASGEVVAPDVLVGGTPCQAFSVAGLRDGLSDPRGELTIKFVQIADAIDKVRKKNNEPETIIWWENVPGVLISQDNAFGCFIAALVGESSELQPAGKRWGNAGCVYGPKRAVAWRVLDAQYFGLAQRRQRVFVVASAREGFDPGKILFEFDSVRRDSAPSREAGETTSHEIAPSLTASGRGVSRTGDTRGQDPVVAVDQQGFRMVAFGEYADDDSASTMKARDYKDATDLVCVHGTQDPIVSTEHAHALGRNGGQENAVLVDPKSYGIPGNWIGRKPENCGNAVEPMRDIAPCLTSTDWHVVAQLRVRRLTPVECERLQGFPDQWTSIPWKGKDSADCPDGHRYKALGNSMAVNVMRWIAGRIEQYLSDSSFNQAPEESSKEYKEQQFELEL